MYKQYAKLSNPCHWVRLLQVASALITVLPKSLHFKAICMYINNNMVEIMKHILIVLDCIKNTNASPNPFSKCDKKDTVKKDLSDVTGTR